MCKELETIYKKCPGCGSLVEDVALYYEAGTFTESAFIAYREEFKYCSKHCAEKASEFRPDIK